jgi:hypothetical protein
MVKVKDDEYWISKSKKLYLKLMKDYCAKYNIKGWTLDFNNTTPNADATCFKEHKLISISPWHLRHYGIIPSFPYDLFLHEFAHVLDFEANLCMNKAIGLDGYECYFSGHGRQFRKTAKKLGVSKNRIPKYNNSYY